MTYSELVILFLKAFTTFLVLGCAYVMTSVDNNDDDDDDEGMYQLAYVTNER